MSHVITAKREKNSESSIRSKYASRPNNPPIRNKQSERKKSMFTKADPSATPPVSGSGWDYVIAEFTPEENERVALHHKIEIVDLLKMEGLEIAMKNADEEDAIFLKNLNDTLDASQLKEYLFQLKRKLVL